MLGTLFGAVDGLMAGLPSLARLIVWALLASAVSMAAYRFTSPQLALQRIRSRRTEVQERLKGYDGAMADAMPLIGESLRLAFAQLFRVLAPTALAAAPVLALLVWLDMAYGYHYPATGQQVAVATEPAGVPARLERDGDGWAVVVGDGAGLRVPLALPVPGLHQFQWWNAIVANPAGYLPEGAPVELVVLDLPTRQHLTIGPDWMRAWYVPFIAVLFAASLALKLGFRII